MSADLLLRAAAKLRKNVAILPIDWRDRPWSPVITDSESLTGVRTCDSPHDSYAVADDADPATAVDWACDGCEHFETYSEGLADYVSTLHPPVALALADWLDIAAKSIEARIIAETHVGVPDGTIKTSDEDAAIAVARAVLREDGESR